MFFFVGKVVLLHYISIEFGAMIRVLEWCCRGTCVCKMCMRFVDFDECGRSGCVFFILAKEGWMQK